MLFKEIIGQDNIKQRLINSVKENRISHSQLFFGSEGCGKLALALAYAQYISCINKKNDDSCGKTKCKSGWISLLYFLQDRHSPHESSSFLFMQDIYWA